MSAWRRRSPGWLDNPAISGAEVVPQADALVRGSLVAAALMSASEPKNDQTMMSEPSSVSSVHRGMSSTVIGPDNTTRLVGALGIPPRANDIFTPIARR